MFVDPDLRQIQALAALKGHGVTGFEINTDAYSRARDSQAIQAQLRLIAEAVEQGRALGLHAYAGHALNTGNVGPVAAIAGMEELNIGHALVARAVIVGLEAAVQEMLAAMSEGKR